MLLCKHYQKILSTILLIYPTIFNGIISRRDQQEQIFLPSDKDWQERMYYRLLEVQKKVNEALESGMSMEEISKKKDKPVFDLSHSTLKLTPSTSPNGSCIGSRQKCFLQNPNVFIKSKSKNFWSLDDIFIAAKLLRKPPESVKFESEYEMRKVYSLIYDVFRYKVILTSALNDVCFYDIFPQFANDQNRTWLMLFELFERNFKKRNSEEVHLQDKLYQAAGVEETSTCLWDLRVRLAASISRMRIKNGALKLSEMLPIHLQNEKVAIAAANQIVTGWINPFILSNKNDAEEYLHKMGFKLQDNNDNQLLVANSYKWDNVCPLFISCFPLDRNIFSKSEFLANNIFVMQDRTFSFGPAIMSKLLDFFEMDGDILQTHISSPRSTAYLAALFYSVNRLNYFFVFGAGSNLKEYRIYMERLGISNIRLFAESFSSIPLKSNRFGSVVGIFASPPNSFSGISDPIDLICSRGGDLSMLEVLTESEISEDGKQRVTQILEEQLLTLQMAMSRPQIQFVLYQTHSIVNSENQEMVDYCIRYVNQTSLKKHQEAFKEKKKLEAISEAEAVNIPSAAVSTGSPRKKNVQLIDAKNQFGSLDSDGKPWDTTKFKECTEDTIDSIKLPEIDEFICDNVPDTCLNQDNCLQHISLGCFLSLIKRKQITRLNAKYLIKMAELRGLFGKSDKTKSTKLKIVKSTDINAETSSTDNRKLHKSKPVADVDNVILRISKPTNASSIRSNLCKISHQLRPMLFNFRQRECYRYLSALNRELSKLQQSIPRTKSWWKYAYHRVRHFEENFLVDQSSNINLLNSESESFRRGFPKTPFPTNVYDIKLNDNNSPHVL